MIESYEGHVVSNIGRIESILSARLSLVRESPTKFCVKVAIHSSCTAQIWYLIIPTVMRRRKVITTLHGADVSVCTSCTFNSAITNKETRPATFDHLFSAFSSKVLEITSSIRHFQGHFQLYFKASLSTKSLLSLWLNVSHVSTYIFRSDC